MTPAGAGAAEAGLARERTRLSWRRTALAVTVVALLAARLAADLGGPLGTLLVAAALAGWVATVAVVYRRGARVLRRLPVPADRTLPFCAVAAVAYGLLGVFLVLAGLR